MPHSQCPTNRELLKNIVEKLTELADLSKGQADARNDDNVKLATDLDYRLDLVHGEKERCVGAWIQHVRDHGC
jgi:hypothetical protein